MVDHLKKSEVELNDLLAEYWRLRHEAGKVESVLNAPNSKAFDHRCLHGNFGQQAQHARHVKLIPLFTWSYYPVLVYILGNTIHHRPELPSTSRTPSETSSN
jgi:hypothetical protein